MTDGRPTLSTLNTSQTQYHKRWKTCTITQDYRAKQNYPNINPNPKGMKVHVAKLMHAGKYVN
jgi:hypothetical protein